MTVRQLSRETGLHFNTIYRLVNGGNAYLTNYEIVARRMGIPTWALFTKNGWEAFSVVTFVEMMTPEDAKLFATIADRLTRKRTRVEI